MGLAVITFGIFALLISLMGLYVFIKNNSIESISESFLSKSFGISPKVNYYFTVACNIIGSLAGIGLIIAGIILLG